MTQLSLMAGIAPVRVGLRKPEPRRGRRAPLAAMWMSGRTRQFIASLLPAGSTPRNSTRSTPESASPSLTNRPRPDSTVVRPIITVRCGKALNNGALLEVDGKINSEVPSTIAVVQHPATCKLRKRLPVLVHRHMNSTLCDRLMICLTGVVQAMQWGLECGIFGLSALWNLGGPSSIRGWCCSAQAPSDLRKRLSAAACRTGLAPGGCCAGWCFWSGQSCYSR